MSDKTNTIVIIRSTKSAAVLRRQQTASWTIRKNQ